MSGTLKTYMFNTAFELNRLHQIIMYSIIYSLIALTSATPVSPGFGASWSKSIMIRSTEEIQQEKQFPLIWPSKTENHHRQFTFQEETEAIQETKESVSYTSRWLCWFYHQMTIVWAVTILIIVWYSRLDFRAMATFESVDFGLGSSRRHLRDRRTESKYATGLTRIYKNLTRIWQEFSRLGEVDFHLKSCFSMPNCYRCHFSWFVRP